MIAPCRLLLFRLCQLCCVPKLILYQLSFHLLDQVEPHGNDGYPVDVGEVRLQEAAEKTACNAIATIATGPALVAFNNSRFKETDWKNLTSTYKSYKRDEIMSTGKFGLGFRSCFHLTDSPIVISGSTILVLDPCKFLSVYVEEGFQKNYVTLFQKEQDKIAREKDREWNLQMQRTVRAQCVFVC